jgi:hypothetical protein
MATMNASSIVSFATTRESGPGSLPAISSKKRSGKGCSQRISTGASSTRLPAPAVSG